MAVDNTLLFGCAGGVLLIVIAILVVCAHRKTRQVRPANDFDHGLEELTARYEENNDHFLRGIHTPAQI